MRIITDFETIDLDDDIIAVPVGNNASSIDGLLRVNSEGKEILDLLRVERTEEEIVSILASKYDTPISTISGFVHSSLSTLSDYGIIE